MTSCKPRARLVNVKQGELVAIKPDDVIVYRGDYKKSYCDRNSGNWCVGTPLGEGDIYRMYGSHIDYGCGNQHALITHAGRGDIERITGKAIYDGPSFWMEAPLIATDSKATYYTYGPQDAHGRPVWHWQRVEGGA